MENLSEFCTCTRLKCPQHPANHGKGCSPCIEKNLKLRQMPSCFFHLLKNAETRTGDSFTEFARLVQEEEKTDEA